MDKFVLEGISRETTNTRAARRLRADGKVPVNVYGGGKANSAFAVDAKAFFKALQGHHRFFEIQCDGKTEAGIIKEVQYDLYGDTAIHADIARVSDSDTVTTTMSILTSGMAKGVSSGGVLDMAYRHIPVRGKVSDLKDSITVDIEALGTNQSIRARDLQMPEGVEQLLSGGTPVIICHGRRGG